jgi:hypothetical protein
MYVDISCPAEAGETYGSTQQWALYNNLSGQSLRLTVMAMLQQHSSFFAMNYIFLPVNFSICLKTPSRISDAMK